MSNSDPHYEQSQRDIEAVCEALRENIKKKFGEPDDQEGDEEERDS